VEGLILSSVIVAGQRHLCEEQTYLAQQAIHQIAALDKLAVEGEGHTGRKTPDGMRGTRVDADEDKNPAGSPRLRARVQEPGGGKCRPKRTSLVSRGTYTFVLESVPGFSTSRAEITPRNIRAVCLSTSRAKRDEEEP